MTIAAVLLAAGRSTRFGAANKLTATLGGLPLGLHAARAVAGLDVSVRFVVTSSGETEWPSFEIVENDRPEDGMAHSLALGIAAARGHGADAVLIALADMPFVPKNHFERILAGYRGPDTLIATSDGDRRMPPALFGSDWFGELEALSGDRGAHGLLQRATIVMAEADILLDIDRPEDLASAQARLDR
jgi:molybdenum cofactor cytidylyltransferase